MTLTAHGHTFTSPVTLSEEEKIRQLAVAINMLESVHNFANEASWRGYRVDPREMRTRNGLILKCREGTPFKLGTPLGALTFPVATYQPHKGRSYWDLMNCTPFHLNDMYVAPYEPCTLHAVNSFQGEHLPHPAFVQEGKPLSDSQLIVLDEEARRLMPLAWQMLGLQSGR